MVPITTPANREILSNATALTKMITSKITYAQNGHEPNGKKEGKFRNPNVVDPLANSYGNGSAPVISPRRKRGALERRMNHNQVSFEQKTFPITFADLGPIRGSTFL